MIAAVLQEAMHTSADQIQQACEELLAAFTTDRI